MVAFIYPLKVTPPGYGFKSSKIEGEITRFYISKQDEIADELIWSNGKKLRYVTGTGPATQREENALHH
ncbi:hypothetical protein TcasGA2_TC012127 [Tribolium castaneum]|uniref:Uncharacterized protein n=1 Tax=Tribolium castaneum TaxID=7070 RepID=D6X1S5_TRICA|nr:hypothetical protein TcasGA2_TC012127 [Tribolium castaneum]